VLLPEHIRVVERMTRPRERRPAYDTIDNIADWLLGLSGERGHRAYSGEQTESSKRHRDLWGLFNAIKVSGHRDTAARKRLRPCNNSDKRGASRMLPG